MQNIKLISYPFFIISIFYAPVLNPLFPATHFGAGIPDIGLVEGCLLLWMATILLDLVRGGFHRVRADGAGIWLLNLGCYTIIVILSLLWAQESYSTGNIRDLFFVVFMPWFFAFIARFYVADRKMIKGIVHHAIISCVVLALGGVVHLISFQGTTVNELRAGFGGVANPNAMAIFLVMNIPLILYGLYRGICNKKIGLWALILIAVGVFTTVSRKGLITMGMSYSIFLLFTKRFKLLLLFALMFFILVAAVMSQKYMSQRYTSNNFNTEFSGKWNMTVVGFDMFLKKPFYGWGYKGYYNNFGKYFKKSYRRKYDAHNNYITALANFGLLGFFPFLGIFILPILSVLQRLVALRSGIGDPVAAITLLTLVVPFMASAWFAGALMYQAVIINLLYVYIVLFLGIISSKPDESIEVKSHV